jgi:hypothetical protein
MVKAVICTFLGRYSAQNGRFFRCSGTTYRSHPQKSSIPSLLRLFCLTFKEGTDRSSQNVGNYRSLLRNTLEEGSSQVLRGGTLNSRIVKDVFEKYIFVCGVL